MKIFVERSNTTIEIKFDGRVRDLLKRLALNPAIVLVTKNNTLITEDDKVKNTDTLNILSVISGG